jgi:hypothetical protein
MGRSAMSIRIISVEVDEKQTQPCQVELDCEEEILMVRYDAVMDGRKCHIQTWEIRPYKVEIANELLESIKGFAQKVCDGYVYEGERGAIFSREAQDAIEAIREEIDALNIEAIREEIDDKIEEDRGIFVFSKDGRKKGGSRHCRSCLKRKKTWKRDL